MPVTSIPPLQLVQLLRRGDCVGCYGSERVLIAHAACRRSIEPLIADPSYMRVLAFILGVHTNAGPKRFCMTFVPEMRSKRLLVNFSRRPRGFRMYLSK